MLIGTSNGGDPEHQYQFVDCEQRLRRRYAHLENALSGRYEWDRYRGYLKIPFRPNIIFLDCQRV
jgi:hypothetical protein